MDKSVRKALLSYVPVNLVTITLIVWSYRNAYWFSFWFFLVLELFFVSWLFFGTRYADWIEKFTLDLMR